MAPLAASTVMAMSERGGPGLRGRMDRILLAGVMLYMSVVVCVAIGAFPSSWQQAPRIAGALLMFAAVVYWFVRAVARPSYRLRNLLGLTGFRAALARLAIGSTCGAIIALQLLDEVATQRIAAFVGIAGIMLGLIATKGFSFLRTANSHA